MREKSSDFRWIQFCGQALARLRRMNNVEPAFYLGRKISRVTRQFQIASVLVASSNSEGLRSTALQHLIGKEKYFLLKGSQ